MAMLTAENIKQRFRPGFSVRTVFAIAVAGMMVRSFAAQEVQFKSPDQAVEALYTAVKTNDQAALSALLGPLASSDNVENDKGERARFVQKYSEMHRLVRQPDGSMELYIGAENWPFPVPLVSSNGTWRFDLDAGSDELLFRRVGEDETTVIETCRAIAHVANHTPYKTDNDAIDNYVRKFANGGNPPTEAFFGYQFRELKTGNGIVVVAYPSQYGVTGVMTFAVTPDGNVYQRDLGNKTTKEAKAMTRYKAGKKWLIAEQ